MCGVIGVYAPQTKENLRLVKRLFEESQVRGKHATGLSYITNEIESVSESIPAKKFISNFNFDVLNGLNTIKLIGHTRYSTSNLKFNQPIFNNLFSIVHNGVISQEAPILWKKHFGYDCDTENDSELILKSISSGNEPIDEFVNSSIASIILSKSNISFFRNGSRPLWYLKYNDGVWISSTKDIFIRAFNQSIEPVMCEPGTIYEISNFEIKFYPTNRRIQDKQVNLECSDYYKQV